MSRARRSPALAAPASRRDGRGTGTEDASGAPRRTRVGPRDGTVLEQTHGESEDPTSMDIQVNRLRVLDRLADDLAHEVKNPLNAVVINLELLKRRVADGETADALERADRVGEEIERVHALVDALFQVMRPECDAGAWVDVERAVRELLPLIELQTKLGRVAFERRPGAGIALVAVRPFTLKQAILNLVAGAVDAAPGGWLELRTFAVDGRVSFVVRCSAARETLLADGDRWAVVRALVREAGGGLRIDVDEDGRAMLLLSLRRAGR